MERALLDYIKLHSSPEDPLLAELYRQTHIRFVNPNMVSGHLQGKFLQFISHIKSPQLILEIGTYTGYSAICLASGLVDGGKLYTIDTNDELNDFRQEYFQKAGMDNIIEAIVGDARDIIPRMDMKFDIIYIDGDKRQYIDYFDISIKKLSKNGIILADNVLWDGKILDTNTTDQQTKGLIKFNSMLAKRQDVEKIILPIFDGITLIYRSVV